MARSAPAYDKSPVLSCIAETIDTRRRGQWSFTAADHSDGASSRASLQPISSLRQPRFKEYAEARSCWDA